jgi:hypothetical protein
MEGDNLGGRARVRQRLQFRVQRRHSFGELLCQPVAHHLWRVRAACAAISINPDQVMGYPKKHRGRRKIGSRKRRLRRKQRRGLRARKA